MKEVNNIFNKLKQFKKTYQNFILILESQGYLSFKNGSISKTFGKFE